MGVTFKTFFNTSYILLLISSVFVSIFLLLSLEKNNDLLPVTCPHVPNVTVTNNTDALHNEIISKIQTSKKRVITTLINLNLSIFRTLYIPAYKTAKDNGASVSFIVSDAVRTSLTPLLLTENLTDIISYTVAYNYTVSTSCIITDSDVFVIPFLLDSNPHSVSQYLHFENCMPIVYQYLAFLDLFKSNNSIKYNGSTYRVVPHRYQARSSAILQSRIQDSKQTGFILFHNPPETLFPLSISSDKIIQSLFSLQPQKLYVYSNSIPIDRTLANFSFYLNLKSLLLRNRTQVRYLANNTQSMESLYKMKVKGLSAFRNFQVKMFNHSGGASFILADNESYIFSHDILSNSFNHFLSIHYATNDDPTSKYLKDFFEEQWSLSTPFKDLYP